MQPHTQELRLLWFVGLNTLVLVGVARVAIAFGGRRRSWVLLDVLLLNYVVEYGLVCGLGALGLLTPWNLTWGATAVTAALIAISHYGTREELIDLAEPPERGRWLSLFILLFAAAYVLAYLVFSRDLPVLETDALAYHLPVAREWLRTGRIGIVQTWYWNPTNTYSPMGAEAFIAWLIAPMGSDIFARFVQAPAMLMLLLAMYRAARTLGAGRTIAACAAAATVLSRSLFSEAGLVKDDLFVAALLFTAVAALAAVAEAKNAGDRLGPWRVGCAIGLLIAMKYPALIVLPLPLLVIQPPLRNWGKTQWGIAAGIALLLAGPWFLRNGIEFGNPLYPLIVNLVGHRIFSGIFNTAVDPAMHTPAGIWRMITSGHFGMPATLLAGVAMLWIIGLFAPGKTNPLRHFAGFGAVGGVILYAIVSPYPEVRYFFPFLLLFYAGAVRGLIVLQRWRPAQSIAATAMVVGATCTTFEIKSIQSVMQFALEGAVLAAVGVGFGMLWRKNRRAAIALLATGIVVIAIAAYVQFNAYIDRVNDNADSVWASPDTYGSLGEAWAFVRHQLLPTATIAYANTNLIDPLYGPLAARQLVYAPVRPSVHNLSDLPPLGERIVQDRIFQVTTAAMEENADLPTWRENLRRSTAEFLFLVKHGSDENPPEARFVEMLGWKPIFENDAAAVYQIGPLGPSR